MRKLSVTKDETVCDLKKIKRHFLNTKSIYINTFIFKQKNEIHFTPHLNDSFVGKEKITEVFHF